MMDAVPNRRLFACVIALLAVPSTAGVVAAVAEPGSGQASAAVDDCGGASPGGIGVGAYVPARGHGTASVDAAFTQSADAVDGDLGELVDLLARDRARTSKS